MHLAMIGLGSMGASMVPRLMEGHECVVQNVKAAALPALQKDGTYDEAVATHVRCVALNERFTSRDEADLASKVLSSMRHGFDGDIEKKTGGAA